MGAGLALQLQNRSGTLIGCLLLLLWYTHWYLVARVPLPQVTEQGVGGARAHTNLEQRFVVRLALLSLKVLLSSSCSSSSSCRTVKYEYRIP